MFFRASTPLRTLNSPTSPLGQCICCSCPLFPSRGNRWPPLWGGLGTERLFPCTGPVSASWPLLGYQRLTPRSEAALVLGSNQGCGGSFCAAHTKQGRVWSSGSKNGGRSSTVTDGELLRHPDSKHPKSHAAHWRTPPPRTHAARNAVLGNGSAAPLWIPMPLGKTTPILSVHRHGDKETHRCWQGTQPLSERAFSKWSEKR